MTFATDGPRMSIRGVCVAAIFLSACSGSFETGSDAATPDNSTDKPAAAACAKDEECAGGSCLGAKGQPQEGNVRFTGGYCTSVSCTIDSQDGCGPDEFCIDGGDELGGFCVKQCSKADGLECVRGDQVCLGLGSFGGCFSRAAVQCHVQNRTGCHPAETCVRIGFEDNSLGRCETTCDPMRPACPGENAGCYFIRTYSTAFCSPAGSDELEEQCACDKCCAPGLACTPDGDGEGRHCKQTCEVATNKGCESGETCKSLKVGSPWGGCVAPGSAGT